VSLDAEKLIGSTPLLAGIDLPALEGLLRIFRPMHFDAGAHLVRQGQLASSAYVIEAGTAEVLTALPGGGETTVATLGPGSVLGELALLEIGTRVATVTARTEVAAHLVERESFRMLLAQRDRAAFEIQARIMRALCRRLRDLNARIVAADAPESAAPPLSGGNAGRDGIRRGAGSFDLRAFLSILPAFRRWDPEEVDAFLGISDVLTLDRGQILFQQGDAGDAAYVVVRGALEILRAESGRRHRIGILGPGRLCGILALIEGQAHSMSATAREPTVILELSRPAFDALFTGNDPVAAKFQEAINRELRMSLTRTTIHLTRLVSQARIRGGRREEKKAEALQQALGMTECGSAG